MVMQGYQDNALYIRVLNSSDSFLDKKITMFVFVLILESLLLHVFEARNTESKMGVYLVLFVEVKF